MFDLPLGDNAVPVLVDILDRIFDRNDMPAAGRVVVDLVDQMGEGGLFAASSLTGDKDQSLFQLSQFGDLLGIVHL